MNNSFVIYNIQNIINSLNSYEVNLFAILFDDFFKASKEIHTVTVLSLGCQFHRYSAQELQHYLYELLL